MSALRVIEGGQSLRRRAELAAEIAAVAAEQEHARLQATTWDARATRLLVRLAELRVELAALSARTANPSCQ